MAIIVSDNVVSTSNWSNFWQAFASLGFVSDSWAFLLPTLRYASAGNSDRNVSVCDVGEL